MKPVSLAQEGASYTLAGDPEVLSSTSVSEDLLSLAEYFGIDGKSTWMFSGDTTKFSMWTFMNKLEAKQDA